MVFCSRRMGEALIPIPMASPPAGGASRMKGEDGNDFSDRGAGLRRGEGIFFFFLFGVCNV